MAKLDWASAYKHIAIRLQDIVYSMIKSICCNAYIHWLTIWGGRGGGVGALINHH